MNGMSTPGATAVLGQLEALRRELVDQAYALERQGRLDAADVAIALSHRLAEIAAPVAQPDAGADAIIAR
jgi:hypothetical protein